ncbi:MAG: LysM peptidoglycan-binding domain-containing protein [Anaerolineae bacterium]|jgi:LysM repeat protein|nr:LysM peptidoglycan-binding domain-containing protein [Anaerolineae bacterium]
MRKPTLTRLIVLAVLPLALAGCFRQAEEPFETLPPPQTNPTSAPGSDFPIETATQDSASLVVTLPSSEEASPTPGIIFTVAVTTDPQLFAPLGGTNTPEPSLTPDPSTDLMGGGGGMLDDLIIVTNTPTTGPSPTSDLLATPTDAFFDEEGNTAEVNPDCIYVVRSGETLLGIANRNGVALSELRAANNIAGDVIYVGDELIIPGCDEPDVTGTPTATPTGIPTGFTSYTVQAGDTLFSIAQRNGTTVQAIVDANELENPNALRIGQTLLIPQD